MNRMKWHMMRQPVFPRAQVVIYDGPLPATPGRR